MLPSIDIFGYSIPSYSTIGLLGLAIAAALALLRAKKYGLTANDVITAAAFAGLGLVIGGMALNVLVRLPEVLANWDAFVAHWPQSIAFFGGMVFYGGLFGALAALWVYCKVLQQNPASVFALAVPVLPLAHGIMRLGCFAVGCCHGVPHDTLGIAFTHAISAPNGVPLLPVQLYEAAFNFLLFAVLWIYSAKPRAPLNLLALYGMSYAIGRFALESLRGDIHRGFILGLSTSQFISILVASTCVAALLIRHFRQKNK